MDLAAELQKYRDREELCKKACFSASALGYNCIVVEDAGFIRYDFRSAIGTTIHGDFDKNKQLALESTCKKFNEQVKPNGQ